MTTAKAVVVTGAAGGIGRAICEHFTAQNLYVVGIDRHQCDWVDRWMQVDIGDLSSLRRAGRMLSEELELEALVHNAAVQPLAGAGDTDYETFVETMRVNVLSVDSLVHAMRGNLSRNSGAVVVVTSVHAVATTAGVNAYATSKAALEGWVRSAAIDLGPGIRVNAVRPGAIDTPKLREGFARWGAATEAERRAVLESRTPLKRIGRPEEIAMAVSFLASQHASFMTGSTLVVDGGASICLGSE